MTKFRLVDITIHVLFPLLAGAIFYLYFSFKGTSLPGSSSIPDGLWAYAFCSAILITWDRRVYKPWLIVAGLTAIMFEVLQYMHFIKGTGDPVDVFVYLLSGAISIQSNRYFSPAYNSKPSTQQPK